MSGRLPSPQDRDDRLRHILSFTDARLSRLGAHDLLEELLDRVREALGADTAVVLLLDEANRELVATFAIGLEEEVRQGARIPLGRGFAGRVAAERHPVILSRVDNSTVVNPILIDHGVQSLLGVPLLAAGSLVGVMHVGSISSRMFSTKDAELLQVAADRAAMAVRELRAASDRLAVEALQRSLVPGAPPGGGGDADGGQVRDRRRRGRRRLVRRVPAAVGRARRRDGRRGRFRAERRGHHGPDAQHAPRVRAGDPEPGGGPEPAGPQDAVLRAGRDGHRAVRGHGFQDGTDVGLQRRAPTSGGGVPWAARRVRGGRGRPAHRGDRFTGPERDHADRAGRRPGRLLHRRADRTPRPVAQRGHEETLRRDGDRHTRGDAVTRAGLHRRDARPHRDG